MAKIPEKWLVVITVLLGAFTIILNNSMLNPAVPCRAPDVLSLRDWVCCLDKSLAHSTELALLT